MKRLAAATVVALLTAGAAVAGEAGGALRVMAPFLLRGDGARASALSGAFTAVADDASAASWNPAGLGQLDSLQLMVMHETSGAGMSYSFASAVGPLGPGHAGLALGVANYEPFDAYDDLGNPLAPEAPIEGAMRLGWAGAPLRLLPTAPVWAGFSLQLVRDAAGNSLAGLGLGALCAASPALTWGAAVNNLGTRRSGFGLPTTMTTGVAVSATPRLRTVGDLGWSVLEARLFAAAGVEWTPFHPITLRAGYRWQGDPGALGAATGWSTGAGVRGEALGFDYSYQVSGSLAAAHRFALVYAGPRQGSRGMDGAIREAIELYHSGKTEESLAAARAVVAADPSAWLAWQVIGNALSARGGSKEALAAYERALALNPANAALRQRVEQLKR